MVQDNVTHAESGDNPSGEHPGGGGKARFQLPSVTRQVTVFGLPYYAESPYWPFIRAKDVTIYYDYRDMSVIYLRVFHDLVIEAHCPYLSSRCTSVTAPEAAHLARRLWTWARREARPASSAPPSSKGQIERLFGTAWGYRADQIPRPAT